MPVEIEVPTEHLHETMKEHAHEGGEAWFMGVALSSALLAVFAAVSALLAGYHANEALIDQIAAANQWAYYQSKSIKAAVLSSKIDILAASGKKVAAKDREKVEEYSSEMEEIKKTAQEKEEGSRHHLHHHETLARSVTLFQISIALGAIALLTRKKSMWYASMILSIAGIAFLVQGLL